MTATLPGVVIEAVVRAYVVPGAAVRAEQKRAAIIAAARETFLKEGLSAGIDLLQGVEMFLRYYAPAGPDAAP
ncbi:hypothetical protein [Streptomyces sp. NPDC047043]|uniref:hypothetical protein n=1 Tax=Streptomyces sp. NPDC047043 TaxID=3154497 RepID=UPI0033D5EB2D